MSSAASPTRPEWAVTCSTPAAEPLLEAVDVLRSDGTARPTDFLRPNSRWSRLLRTQSDHRLWETAVLFHLRDAFRAGDVWLTRCVSTGPAGGREGATLDTGAGRGREGQPRRRGPAGAAKAGPGADSRRRYGAGRGARGRTTLRPRPPSNEAAPPKGRNDRPRPTDEMRPAHEGPERRYALAG